MLFEKNTLFGLLVLWFTGWSAVSPGHWPFCARASTSVPGAPASSLVTGSHVLVLNPGVEICAPVWVATALLCTFQPALPRLVMSLAPVSAGELRAMAAARAGAARWPPTESPAVALAGAPCELDTSHASVVTDTTAAAQRAERGRTDCLIAATPVPRSLPRTTGATALGVANAQLVRNLSKQTCQEVNRRR